MPGPGNYEKNENGISKFNEAPKFGFGTSKRPEPSPRKEGIPGPGHYRVKSTFADVPRYLIPNQDDKFKYI